MRWLKVFEDFNEDIIELTNLLKKYDIPCDIWGTGKSKTIKHLMREIHQKECILKETNHGLVRLIEFVGIRIFYTDETGQKWFLKEERQEFNDGRVRKRDIPNSVSEKMVSGEDPLLSAIRGVSEELGVKIESHQLIKFRDLHYDGGSISYPGLDTKYKGYRFTCNFTSEQYNPNGYIEVQKDKKTFFNWIKI